MPKSWVRVNWNTTCDVCVNANYVDVAGQTNVVFRVETGTNTFEVIDGTVNPWGRQIVARADQIEIESASQNAPIIIVPLPLTPPIDLPPPGP